MPSDAAACNASLAVAIMTPPAAASSRSTIRRRLADLQRVACVRFFVGVPPPAGWVPASRSARGGTMACDYAALRKRPREARRSRPPRHELRPGAEADVVVGDYPDHYFNLARKVRAELQWAATAGVSWILMLDEDLASTIQPRELRARLQTLLRLGGGEASPLILGDVLDCLTGAATMCHEHPFLGWHAQPDPFGRLPPIPLGSRGMALNVAAARRLLDDGPGAPARCMQPYSDRALGVWAYQRGIPIANASWAGQAPRVCRWLRSNHRRTPRGGGGGADGFACARAPVATTKATFTAGEYHAAVRCDCVPV